MVAIDAIITSGRDAPSRLNRIDTRETRLRFEYRFTMQTCSIEILSIVRWNTRWTKILTCDSIVDLANWFVAHSSAIGSWRRLLTSSSVAFFVRYDTFVCFISFIYHLSLSVYISRKYWITWFAFDTRFEKYDVCRCWPLLFDLDFSSIVSIREFYWKFRFKRFQ